MNERQAGRPRDRVSKARVTREATRAENEAENGAADELSVDRVPKRRRRGSVRSGRRLLLVGTVLVAGTVLLALPNLLALLFPGPLLDLASTQIAGRLTAASLSVGWFQPLVVSEPQAVSPEGEVVFKAGEVSTQKSLLGLIFAPRSLGLIHVARPHLTVRTWEGGSNVEQLLEPLLSQPPSDEPLEVAWHIEQGEIELLATDEPQPVAIDILELSGRLVQDQDVHLFLDGELEVATSEQRGKLVLKSAARDGESGAPGNEFDVFCRAEGLPLASLQPLLVRAAAAPRVAGQFSGEAHITWEPSAHQGRLDSIDCQLTALRMVTHANAPQRDIRLDRLAVRGAAQWTETQLDIDRLTVSSDVGTVQLRTAVPFAPDADLLTAARQLLARSRIELAAEVDLAALAAAAPDVLRLREDVSIAAGQVKLDVASEPQAGQAHWTAAVSTSALEGVRGGQPFVWNEPLHAELAAVWTGQRLIFEKLVCRSDFLDASLEGTPQQGAVTATANLDRLSERLGQFVNLGGVQLGGQVQSRTEWQHEAPRLAVNGQVELDEFVVALPDRPRWQEPRLALQYVLRTQTGGQRAVEAIEAASLELTAPAERVVLELTAPVQGDVAQTPWPVALNISSRLEKWLPRISPLVTIDDLTLGGVLEVKGSLKITPELIQIESLDADVEELAVTRENVRIVEPRAILQLAGQWERAASTWLTRELKFQSSAFALASYDLRASVAQPPQASGNLAFTGDLLRLQSWFSSATPSTVRIDGELTGKAELSSADGTVLVDSQVDVNQFQVAGLRPIAATAARPASTTTDWKALWREPKIALRARAEWNAGTQGLQLHDLSATGEGVQLSGKGSFRDVSGQMLVDINGGLHYDLAQLTPKLRGLTISDLKLEGRQQESFSLKGPLLRPVLTASAATPADTSLVPLELAGQGTLGWQGADVLGIVIGPGQMRGELREARVQFAPLEIPVSGGRLQTAPWIDLAATPARLVHPPGKILENVQLSPELCRSWLQFVAPLVANATDAEGQFGVQIERLSMPLGAGNQADVAGALLIDQARVGPGPVSRVLLGAVDRVLAIVGRKSPLGSDRQWITLPAQQVAFEVENGRVVHREFKMLVGDAQITTRGWVALDQTMSLTMEIPIRDEWADRNRLLTAMRGKTITIPIEGTLSQPRLEDGILKELSRQALGNAAGGLLRGLLERQLQPQE